MRWLQVACGDEEEHTSTDTSTDTSTEGPHAGVIPSTLASVVRVLRRNFDSLTVKVAGASLSTSTVLQPTEILLRRPTLSRRPQLKQQSSSTVSATPEEEMEGQNKRGVRFVVIAGRVEPLNEAGSEEGKGNGTIRVKSTASYLSALAYRGTRLRSIINALADQRVGLLLCTEALKDPLPSLCAESRITAVQYVEPEDVAWLVEVTGVVPLTESDLHDDALLRTALQHSPSLGRLHQAEQVAAAGASFLHLKGLTYTSRPMGCQVIMRGPTEGMCDEYLKITGRMLVLLDAWLGGKDSHGGMLVTGGGAWQAAAQFYCLEKADEIGQSSQPHNSSGGGDGEGPFRGSPSNDVEIALRTIGAALGAVPTALFLSSRAHVKNRDHHSVHRGCHTIIHALQTRLKEHAEDAKSDGSTLPGMVLDTNKGCTISSSTTNQRLLHPLPVALSSVYHASNILTQLLCLDDEHLLRGKQMSHPSPSSKGITDESESDSD